MTPQQIVRAVYHAGTLQLLEPVDLPDGVEVQIVVPGRQAFGTQASGPLYPLRPHPPDTLGRLGGVIAVGGDALRDSEALYDGDCD
jgi:hypothetical protein